MNDFPKAQERKRLTSEEHKFLVGMIEHHEMALVMSKDILSSTEDFDIVSLAYSIFLTQTNEIELMQQMIKMRKVVN